MKKHSKIQNTYKTHLHKFRPKYPPKYSLAKYDLHMASSLTAFFPSRTGTGPVNPPQKFSPCPVLPKTVSVTATVRWALVSVTATVRFPANYYNCDGFSSFSFCLSGPPVRGPCARAPFGGQPDCTKRNQHTTHKRPVCRTPADNGIPPAPTSRQGYSRPARNRSHPNTNRPKTNFGRYRRKVRRRFSPQKPPSPGHSKLRNGLLSLGGEPSLITLLKNWFPQSLQRQWQPPIFCEFGMHLWLFSVKKVISRSSSTREGRDVVDFPSLTNQPRVGWRMSAGRLLSGRISLTFSTCLVLVS